MGRSMEFVLTDIRNLGSKLEFKGGKITLKVEGYLPFVMLDSFNCPPLKKILTQVPTMPMGSFVAYGVNGLYFAPWDDEALHITIQSSHADGRHSKNHIFVMSKDNIKTILEIMGVIDAVAQIDGKPAPNFDFNIDRLIILQPDNSMTNE